MPPNPFMKNVGYQQTPTGDFLYGRFQETLSATATGSKHDRLRQGSEQASQLQQSVLSLAATDPDLFTNPKRAEERTRKISTASGLPEQQVSMAMQSADEQIRRDPRASKMGGLGGLLAAESPSTLAKQKAAQEKAVANEQAKEHLRREKAQAVGELKKKLGLEKEDAVGLRIALSDEAKKLKHTIDESQTATHAEEEAARSKLGDIKKLQGLLKEGEGRSNTGDSAAGKTIKISGGSLNLNVTNNGQADVDITGVGAGL